MRSGIIKSHKQENSGRVAESVKRFFLRFHLRSLFRLFVVVIFLVALTPCVLISWLLLDLVVEQSREQALNRLQHSAKLQAEILDRELSFQFNSFMRLSQNKDMQLMFSSSGLDYEVGVKIQHYVEKFPLVVASYIRTRDAWPIEVYPLSAEMVELDEIESQIEGYLAETEKSQQVEMLIFNLFAPHIVSALTPNNDEHKPFDAKASDWVMVMVLPILSPAAAGESFQVLGSVVALAPYSGLYQTLGQRGSDSGFVELLDINNRDTALFSYHQKLTSTLAKNVLSLDSTVQYQNFGVILRSSESVNTISMIVVEKNWRLVTFVVGGLMVVFFIASIAIWRIRKQIAQLICQVQRFSIGDYQYRPTGLSFLEFKQAAEVLGLLSEKVIIDQSQLELEVDNRTAALQHTHSELQTSMESLKLTQGELVQNEKMASLARLMSGIAAELYFPLSKSAVAIDSIESASDFLNTSLASGKVKKHTFRNEVKKINALCQIVTDNLTRSSELVLLFKELSPELDAEELSQFELKQLLHRLAKIWSKDPRASNVFIHILGEECIVESYVGLMRKVLTAFFVNSIEHAFNDQAHGNVTLICADKGEMVELCFYDDGCGVGPLSIERIFEPFYTSTQKEGSVGLGLHLAYNLVSERLHGYLTAENRDEGGLRLWLRFPKKHSSNTDADWYKIQTASTKLQY